MVARLNLTHMHPSSPPIRLIIIINSYWLAYGHGDGHPSFAALALAHAHEHPHLIVFVFVQTPV